MDQTGQTTYASDESSPDLGTLCVQGDANGSVVDAARTKALRCLADVLDGLTMVLYNRKCSRN